MIVMKFGGTSVESAEAIQRVTGIVKSRLDRQADRRRVRDGQDHQPAAEDRRPRRLPASATKLCGELISLRDFHLRESGMERTVDEHFQELSELVKGLAVLGELTPRSIDAISSFGERLSSLIVTNYFQHHGLNAVHVDSRKVIVTDHRHTQAVPLLDRNLCQARRRHSAAREAARRGDGRLHRIHRGRRHHHARPRRLGFHGFHRRRGHRRRRDPDLDRRGRHAHRRSHASFRARIA